MIMIVAGLALLVAICVTRSLYAPHVRTLNGYSPHAPMGYRYYGNGPRALAVSPDGKAVATCGPRSAPDRVEIWDARTGERFRILSVAAIGESEPCLAFSPDSKLLTAALGAAVGVWDVSTGRLLNESRVTVAGPGGGVVWYGLAFGEDGVLRAAGTEYGPPTREGVVSVWDGRTGHVLWRRLFGRVDTGAISPDGCMLYVEYVPPHPPPPGGGADMTPSDTALLDIRTGEPVATSIRGPVLSFSSDGRLLLTAEVAGRMAIWDIASQARLRTIPYATEGNRLPASYALSRDGRLLAIGTKWDCSTVFEKLGLNSSYRGEVLLLNATTGRLLRKGPTVEGGVEDLAFSPDARTIWVNCCAAWDLGER